MGWRTSTGSRPPPGKPQIHHCSVNRFNVAKAFFCWNQVQFLCGLAVKFVGPSRIVSSTLYCIVVDSNLVFKIIGI